MIPARLTLVGAALFAVGMMVVGLALSTTGGGSANVEAGQESCATITQTPDPTSTSAPSSTPDPTSSIELSSFGNGPVICTATPEDDDDDDDDPTRTRTATRTATAAATQPPQPTVPAPQPTSPSGGAGAGGVQPPETGTGPSTDDSLSMLLMTLGAVVAVAGGSFVLLGVTRKR